MFNLELDNSGRQFLPPFSVAEVTKRVKGRVIDLTKGFELGPGDRLDIVWCCGYDGDHKNGHQKINHCWKLRRIVYEENPNGPGLIPKRYDLSDWVEVSVLLPPKMAMIKGERRLKIADDGTHWYCNKCYKFVEKEAEDLN